MITLSAIEIFDLLLRFATVGQLLLVLLIVSLPPTRNLSGCFVLTCLMSYLLLTTPIPDQYYGALRPPLLLLTDLTSYAIWLFAMQHFRDDFSLKNWPIWVYLALTVWFSWLIYFFLGLQGKGDFHDYHHMLGLLILGSIIIEAAYGLYNDLVAKRRSLRKMTLLFGAFYMLSLTIFELVFTELRDTPQFSIINAALIFLSMSFVSVQLLHPTRLNTKQHKTDENSTNISQITPKQQQAYNNLLGLMKGGYYLQSNITITSLAQEISLPEHQLRELINRVLGFRNFSQFLNSYRIPAACKELQDPQRLHIPILTIALELGFGSIAPFNRNFKLHTGITPKEYRQKFQNR